MTEGVVVLGEEVRLRFPGDWKVIGVRAEYVCGANSCGKSWINRLKMRDTISKHETFPLLT